MVIHYPPVRLRHNSDQPIAITNVLVTTSDSSSRTGEIPLGTPTCSARTRHGRWALYPSGEEVVVVWPGGALTGLPAEVAGALDRLGGDGYWLSGATNQSGHRTHSPASRPGATPPAAPIPLPDPSPQPTPARAA